MSEIQLTTEPPIPKDPKKPVDGEEISTGGTKKILKGVGVAAGTVVGFGGLVWLLDKIRGGKKGEEEETVLNPQTAEEQQGTFDKTNLKLYSKEGMNSSQLGIVGINSPDHLNEAPYSMYGTPVYNLTAEFGPSWLFAVVLNDDGKEILQDDHRIISEPAVKGMVEQLGLVNNPAGQQTLREYWVRAHSNRQVALNLINGTLIPGASGHPQVVKFYQCSLDVYNKDLDKTTWQDRLDGVKACAVQAKAEHGHKVEFNDDSFVSLAEDAIIKAGGRIEDFGVLETAANEPIDPNNLQTTALALDIADYGAGQGKLLEGGFNPLPLVLGGLFLLRVGPTLPKAIIADISDRVEDVYYWFRLGQGKKVMRNLMVLGQKIINPKANQ